MSAAWTALPQGEDVAIEPGKVYAIVASVSASRTKSSILAAVAKYFPGVTVLSYAEQGDPQGPEPDPDTDRKAIGAVVKSESFTGPLAWSKGIAIIAPNLYTLVGAWRLSSSSEAQAGVPWAGVIGAYKPTPNPWGWVFGIGLAMAGGYIVYREWDRIAAMAREPLLETP